MSTILARRFAIICLTFVLFAIGFWMIVDAHQRPPRISQFELSAPCPLPQSIYCKARI